MSDSNDLTSVSHQPVKCSRTQSDKPYPSPVAHLPSKMQSGTQHMRRVFTGSSRCILGHGKRQGSLGWCQSCWPRCNANDKLINRDKVKWSAMRVVHYSQIERKALGIAWEFNVSTCTSSVVRLQLSLTTSHSSPYSVSHRPTHLHAYKTGYWNFSHTTCLLFTVCCSLRWKEPGRLQSDDLSKEAEEFVNQIDPNAQHAPQLDTKTLYSIIV